ncbi:hypothetical protein QM306_38410, partial [Burkholderia cenocepacia]|nr:hypothetical protein [Burkholderia cenocepacia]
RDAPAIRDTLAETGVPLVDHATLEGAVHAAADLAEPGDAVLLSPACASLDMFRNYAHRAEVFRAMGVVPEHVEARACRRQQHRIARLGQIGRRVHRAFERRVVHERHAGFGERVADRRRVA